MSARSGGFFAAAAMIVLLCGCTSRADRASKAAMTAEAFLQQGDLKSALESATEATSERDDIADYWQLQARIELAAGHQAGAFNAFQRVIELDPNNADVLTVLGRLGLALGQGEAVDGYADRLLAADPTNRNARVMKAGAALQRDDKPTAKRYIDELLAANPADSDGLLLKARLLANSNDARGAAKLIEDTLTSSRDDPSSRLGFLRTLYSQAGDRANLLRTLERMATAEKAPVDVRLAYATMLYEDGRADRAGDVIAGVMKSSPNDLDVASDILEIWRDAGPDTPPAAVLAAADPSLSLEMKALKAQRANDTGRPDVALALLGPGVGRAATNSANADARAAYASALALQGNAARAGAILNEILQSDPGQPRALLARARLSAIRRDFTAAIADARRVVTDDPKNVTARLLLADFLRGNGQADLSLAQLHEGAQQAPDNARMAARLAETLIASGDKAGARDALSELVHSAPISPRARQLQIRLCDTMGDAACVADGRKGLAFAQGSQAPGPAPDIGSRP